jgi:hypothetical protein
MEKKRGRWRELVGLLAVGVLVCVFYFLSDAKRNQWVGIPEYKPFGTYRPKRTPPADIGTKDVKPAVTEEHAKLSGEMTVSMGVSVSSPSVPRHLRPSPPQVTTPSCDSAVLDSIGQKLLATFRPVYDPLLTPVNYSLEKVDTLSQLLLGLQNPAQEPKLPNRNARAVASEGWKTVLDRIVASQPPQQADDLNHPINDSQSDKLQNLIIQGQTAQSASLSNDGGAAYGPGVSSAAQTLAPQQLGSSSSPLGGTNALSGTTGVATDALRSARPLGR